MLRLREALNSLDLVHFQRILGERDDPAMPETKRRHRVHRIASEDTYLADEARGPFQNLAQGDRERLLSEVVWRLTCHVEGSVIRSPGKPVALERGFEMVKLVRNGRSEFCVTVTPDEPSGGTSPAPA